MSDIPSLLESLNIEVARTSRRPDGSEQLWAHCPFHFNGTRRDSLPDNWSINSETGRHKCWSCGFEGTVEWLVHKVTGLPLDEAKKASGHDARVMERVQRLDPWGGERPVERPPMDEARLKMYDDPIPEWALARRGLYRASCSAFGVRWSDNFVHGVADRKTYSNCWITPIRDPETNKAWGMQVKQEGEGRFFRNLPADVRKSKTLFGIDLIDGSPSVVLVESPLDAVYLHGLGIPAVSSFGAHVSDAQMELLILRTDHIILALDDDDAGRASRNRLLGLQSNGRPDRQAQDYSKRIRLSYVDYEKEGTGAKDIGECPPAVARALVKRSVSGLALTLGLVG